MSLRMEFPFDADITFLLFGLCKRHGWKPGFSEAYWASVVLYIPPRIMHYFGLKKSSFPMTKVRCFICTWKVQPTKSKLLLDLIISIIAEATRIFQ
jgi:hypothetical protein